MHKVSTLIHISRCSRELNFISSWIAGAGGFHVTRILYTSSWNPSWVIGRLEHLWTGGFLPDYDAGLFCGVLDPRGALCSCKHRYVQITPGKRGRQEFPKLPASHANRRAGLCAAVVHHQNSPSSEITPGDSPAGNSRAGFRAAAIRPLATHIRSLLIYLSKKRDEELSDHQ